MSKTLNFNQIKKQYFTVTLPNDEATTLMICTPTKAIMDEFISMQDNLSADSMGTGAIDELYSLCAKIMSRNKGGIKITADKLVKILDFEDIIVFIRGYTDFISEVTNSKN